MSRRSTSRKAAPILRQELEVEAALAREAVIRLHVEHALELIRQAEGRVSAMRMLDIYNRVLELSGTVEEIVANRVLAALGDQRRSVGARPRLGAAQPDELLSDGDSLLRTLRRRLRGRVHIELRRAVELRVGMVHTALLDLHVTRARGFVRLLADAHDMRDACAIYIRMVQIPAPMAAMLYVLVLGRIAAEEGAPASAWPASAAAPVPTPRDARTARRAGLRSQRTRSSA
jgi:hypothetical protein